MKKLTDTEIISMIFDEMKKAERKFPGFPSDIVHASAIVQEECGELVKACLDYYYNRGSEDDVIKEAVQTGAMIYRFLFNWEGYKNGSNNKD